MLTKLDEAGVTVIVTRYVGEIHDFGILKGARNVSCDTGGHTSSEHVLKEYLNKLVVRTGRIEKLIPDSGIAF